MLTFERERQCKFGCVVGGSLATDTVAIPTGRHAERQGFFFDDPCP